MITQDEAHEIVNKLNWKRRLKDAGYFRCGNNERKRYNQLLLDVRDGEVTVQKVFDNWFLRDSAFNIKLCRVSEQKGRRSFKSMFKYITVKGMHENVNKFYDDYDD